MPWAVASLIKSAWLRGLLGATIASCIVFSDLLRHGSSLIPRTLSSPSTSAVRGDSADSLAVSKCCSEDELSVVAEVVRSGVLSRQVGDHGGPPFSPAQYAALHPCTSQCRANSTFAATQQPDTLSAGNGGNGSAFSGVGFIVLASQSTIDRAELLLEAWGSNVAPPWMRLYSDINNPALRMLTLPDTAGKGSYDDAQHRVLKGLQHALTQQPFDTAPFVMIIGDDTYVNLPELRYFTSQWNPDVPALFGYQWWRDYGTWPSGGGGMLMTRAAAHALAKALYTDICPFEGHDDVTLGYCCWRLGIPLVHSALFDGMGEYFKWLDDPLKNKAAIASVIAIHRAFPRENMLRLKNIYAEMA